jgi:hypothetical protein
MGMMACTCYPKLCRTPTSGVLWFKASLGKKVSEIPISMEENWAWWCAPVIPVAGNLK